MTYTAKEHGRICGSYKGGEWVTKRGRTTLMFETSRYSRKLLPYRCKAMEKRPTHILSDHSITSQLSSAASKKTHRVTHTAFDLPLQRITFNEHSGTTRKEQGISNLSQLASESSTFFHFISNNPPSHAGPHSQYVPDTSPHLFTSQCSPLASLPASPPAVPMHP